MDDGNGIAARTILFSNETLLLWLAVSLAVVFLGLLAFDFIRRRRRAPQWRRSKPESLRAKLLKPVHRAQVFRSELEQLLEERSHRKGRPPPPPPETPETPP